MLADYQYTEESGENNAPVLLQGWKLCRITAFAAPRLNHAGTATGSFIEFAVEDNMRLIKRSVYVSLDHPSDFVRDKTIRIGKMLKQMFPDALDDVDYVERAFWCLFRQYTDKKSGEVKETFFDHKDNVSLDGLMTLSGKNVPQDPPADNAEKTTQDDEDIPF